MGLRDRFKKRVAKAIGRDSPQAKDAAPKPPPPTKRPRASYRTHAAEAPSPTLEAPAEPSTPPVQAPAQVEPTPAPTDEAPMEKREIDTEVSYTVRLFNRDESLDTEIQVYEGEFVLDAADRCAVDLPSSCRNGGCTVCAGRLVTGTMDMEDQYVLEEEHIQDGFRLLCCAVVTSDAVIETHQDEVVA